MKITSLSASICYKHVHYKRGLLYCVDLREDTFNSCWLNCSLILQVYSKGESLVNGLVNFGQNTSATLVIRTNRKMSPSASVIVYGVSSGYLITAMQKIQVSLNLNAQVLHYPNFFTISSKLYESYRKNCLIWTWILAKSWMQQTSTRKKNI